MRVDEVVARTTWERWQLANPVVVASGFQNADNNGIFEVIEDDDQRKIEQEFLELLLS